LAILRQLAKITLLGNDNMPVKAAKIQVTERQFDILDEIVASRTASVRLVQRAKIVLLAFAKHNCEQIGELVGLNPQQASVWRKRWRDAWSLDNLEDRMLRFIDYYNATMANPYRWTYDGTLLCK
jgi:hypothetical protein